MNKPELNLTDALNLISDPPSAEIVKTPVSENTGGIEKAEQDFQEIRANLKEIIEKNKLAVDGILDLSLQSENPRAYEVVAQLINSSLEANDKLMELHKKMKDIKGSISSDNTTNQLTQNNAIFIGSTKELMDLIKPKRNAE